MARVTKKLDEKTLRVLARIGKRHAEGTARAARLKQQVDEEFHEDLVHALRDRGLDEASVPSFDIDFQAGTASWEPKKKPEKDEKEDCSCEEKPPVPFAKAAAELAGKK